MIKIVCRTVDITPSMSVYMHGHAMRKGKSKGVHDKLEAVISWLRVDEKLNLFVNCDLIQTDYDFVHEFKRKITEKCDIDEDAIVLSATHTHSGPVIKTADKDMPADEEYRRTLIDTVVNGALDIYGKEKEVYRVMLTKGVSEGYYGNRNGKDKYGDNNIYLIEFKGEDGRNIAAYCNLSCHSTVLGPEVYDISADLLGNLRRKLTPYLGVTPMMMNGNSGDMSNRLYRHNNDFDELDRVTDGLAHQIMGFADRKEIKLSDEKIRTFTYHVEYDTDKKMLEDRVAEFEKKLEHTEEYDAIKWIISEIAGFKRKLAVDHVDLKFETTIISMGDLELVILPCELVSAFGRQIKKTSTAGECIVWGYANGYTTYVVEASEFNGGHDGIATSLKKGQAEEYVAKIIQNMF